MRSSAPKFVRKNTGFPKTRSLRMSQGVIIATKMIAARTTPAKDFLPARPRLYHAYRPEAGRNERSDGLLRAATPHIRPKRSHDFTPSESSIEAAIQKIVVIRSAERL